jgi:hypothetical protein
MNADSFGDEVLTMTGFFQDVNLLSLPICWSFGNIVASPPTLC